MCSSKVIVIHAHILSKIIVMTPLAFQHVVRIGEGEGTAMLATIYEGTISIAWERFG